MIFNPQRRSARSMPWAILRVLRLFVFLAAGLSGCAKQPLAPEPEPVSAFVPTITQSLEPLRSETVNRIFTRSCSACHGSDGHGITAVAPDLRRAKPRSFEQWQQYLLGNAPAGHPGAQMPPPTWLNVDEVDVIANYLVSLAPPNAQPTPSATPR